MDASTAAAGICDLPAEHKDFRDTIRQIVKERIAARVATVGACGRYPWDVRQLSAGRGPDEIQRLVTGRAPAR